MWPDFICSLACAFVTQVSRATSYGIFRMLSYEGCQLELNISKKVKLDCTLRRVSKKIKHSSGTALRQTA